MRVEIGSIQIWSAAILFLSSFLMTGVESRLPPKLLKVASGATKALYARGYGYSVIPLPPRMVLQTNVARREVHHHQPPQPRRGNKRPKRGKRPPPLPPSYAPKYQDYWPTRKRRPRPRPHWEGPPNAEYVDEPGPTGGEEEFEPDPGEEVEGSSGYRDFEDFVAKHSELYTEGYNPRGRPTRRPHRYKDDDGAFSESSRFVYPRRPRPPRTGRPSTKLYSAAIPSRYQEETDYAEDEEEEEGYSRYHHHGGGRYRGYEEEEEDEEEPKYYSSRFRDWNPDNVYHDRKYQESNYRHKTRTKHQAKIPRIVTGNKKQKYNQLYHEPVDNKWRNNSEYVRYRNEPKTNWKEMMELENELQWKGGGEGAQWQEYNSPKPVTVRTDAANPDQEEQWKSNRPLGIGRFYEKEVKSPEWKEPEIITKHNAGIWEAKDKDETSKTAGSWQEEHTVGYGIEMEGGGGRRKTTEPDVVYGQASYTKPRAPHLGYNRPRLLDVRSTAPNIGYNRRYNVPDIGFNQGMELADDKSNPWQVYIRK